MLRGLNIRDMLLIERLELEFQPGLNVLTGETGAGKSILLDSLGFVLGWRGRTDLVRAGARQAEVTAWFELAGGHPARAVLEQAGLPVTPELILRRTNGRDGRKTAFVNDRRCSADVLRALSDCLVELHGQQNDRGLLNRRGHRGLLDGFAGVDTGKIRKLWRRMGASDAALTAAKAELATAQQDADYLHHALDELTRLAPTPGEDQALDARRRLMQDAGRIREDIVKAANALGDQGAEGLIADAGRWLDGVLHQVDGRLENALSALSRTLNELAEAQAAIGTCLSALEFDPLELEAVEERLFAIRGLARKHGVQPDDLASFADDLHQRLLAIDTGQQHLKDLSLAAEKAKADYSGCAARLSDKRKSAALRLDRAVMAELAPLKMERAAFATEISATDPGPTGTDVVSFSVATNPGAPAGPIDKIASGGELSRFLLALKVCLSARNAGITMIFDEIDRGIGGATADAVGRRLAALAQGSQVLVVTHSPQVAALGDHHWQVSKSIQKDKTRSTVSALDAAARVDEIARMLAGEVITDEARAAASALLVR
jgi:DNA repair protein RecN (Recombination protein N)